MFSSISFSRTLEMLKLNDVEIISTQRIDVCKHVYTAHISYKQHHFQLSYINGALYLSHREYGRSKFPTVSSMFDCMQKIAAGADVPFLYPAYVTVNIWRGDNDTLELRFDTNSCPLGKLDEVYASLCKPLQELGCSVPTKKGRQFILQIQTSKLYHIKRKFYMNPTNPIYNWHDYSGKGGRGLAGPLTGPLTGPLMGV